MTCILSTGILLALQTRDDSIAGFQLLQQQTASLGHTQRMDKLASQLEGTQAQLLTAQVHE